MSNIPDLSNMCSFMEIIEAEKREKENLQKDFNHLKREYDKLYFESRLIPLKRKIVSVGTQSKINTATVSTETVLETADKSTQTGAGEDPQETQAETIIKYVECLPGNEHCCDCGENNVSWISLKFGVVLCIRCSSFHHFGMLHSRVQSLTHDKITTANLLIARVMGNNTLNNVMEANIDNIKTNPESSMEERYDFFYAKYVHKHYVTRTCLNDSDLRSKLEQSIINADLSQLLQVWAEGADLSAVLPSSQLGETALHLAVLREVGSTLHIVDFLIHHTSPLGLNKATNITNMPDLTGKNTALHLCALHNRPECMKLLLRSGADFKLKNEQGKTALAITKEMGHNACGELIECAFRNQKGAFDHINFDWNLPHDDRSMDFSDDDTVVDEKKRSHLSSYADSESPVAIQSRLLTSDSIQSGSSPNVVSNQLRRQMSNQLSNKNAQSDTSPKKQNLFPQQDAEVRLSSSSMSNITENRKSLSLSKMEECTAPITHNQTKSPSSNDGRVPLSAMYVQSDIGPVQSPSSMTNITGNYAQTMNLSDRKSLSSSKMDKFTALMPHNRATSNDGRDISHDDYSYTEDMDYSNGFDAHSTLSDISTNRKYEPQLVPQLDEFDSGTIETGSGASKLMEIFETKSSSGATIRLDADDTASSLLTQLQDDDLFKSFVVEQKKSNWVCKYCKIQNDQAHSKCDYCSCANPNASSNIVADNEVTPLKPAFSFCSMPLSPKISIPSFDSVFKSIVEKQNSTWECLDLMSGTNTTSSSALTATSIFPFGNEAANLATSSHSKTKDNRAKEPVQKRLVPAQLAFETTPKPAAPTAADNVFKLIVEKQLSSSWECSLCMLKNSNGIEKCAYCETPKDNSAPRNSSKKEFVGLVSSSKFSFGSPSFQFASPISSLTAATTATTAASTKSSIFGSPFQTSILSFKTMTAEPTATKFVTESVFANNSVSNKMGVNVKDKIELKTDEKIENSEKNIVDKTNDDMSVMNADKNREIGLQSKRQSLARSASENQETRSKHKNSFVNEVDDEHSTQSTPPKLRRSKRMQTFPPSNQKDQVAQSQPDDQYKSTTDNEHVTRSRKRIFDDKKTQDSTIEIKDKKSDDKKLMSSEIDVEAKDEIESKTDEKNENCQKNVGFDDIEFIDAAADTNHDQLSNGSDVNVVVRKRDRKAGITKVKANISMGSVKSCEMCGYKTQHSGHFNVHQTEGCGKSNAAKDRNCPVCCKQFSYNQLRFHLNQYIEDSSKAKNGHSNFSPKEHQMMLDQLKSERKMEKNKAIAASKVLCSGQGLQHGVLGREIQSLIDTSRAGLGVLTTYCAGPRKVAYCELYDHGDGKFALNIRPQEPGTHLLTIKYDSQHVNGSPFALEVARESEAS